MLLGEMDFHPKNAQRKGNAVTYFKQSEHIEDFLITIGAPLTAMEVMNAELEKSLRGGVNRRVNCDSANLDKAVDAAQDQLEAIRRPLLRWLAKLAVAAVSTGVMYALLLYVFCLEAVVEEFAQTAPWLLWLTAVLGLLVFVVYDILLRRFTVMWRRKKRKA